MNPGTTNLLVTVQQMVDATAPQENNYRTPTVSGHQLEDLLRVVTVSVASAGAAMALVTAMPAAEAAAVGAPHTGLAGELAAGAIAGGRGHANNHVTGVSRSGYDAHRVIKEIRSKKFSEAGDSDGFPVFST
jgi:hypothetical protein